ncbi:MAG: Smr/MutS family protein [Pseudomonadota bacterium]|nr:Smr/MutS family protein [Pseudomonadota bacterium]
MNDENDLSSKDAELFREAMSDVRVLKHDRVSLRRTPPTAEPHFTRKDEAAALRESLLGPTDIELESGEELFFARPEIRRTALRKLRRGQYVVEDVLDLHGLNRHQARQAVNEFLHEACTARMGCVRIIHGKGLRSPQQRAILKHKLNTWLTHCEAVLAFCSARPHDGGTGAVYVLLKRRS